MREYLGRIKLICDHPISETMQISIILTSLSTKHEHIVAVITTSRQPYDLAGVASILLDAEAR